MKKLAGYFFIILFFSLLAAAPVLASFTPNDPYYGNQWYLSRIKADNAWEKISSSPDIVIAVVDSGIQISHPDLHGNIWSNTKEIPDNGLDDDQNGFIDDINGWDFVNNTPDPSPKFSSGWTEAGVSHGTVIAGIIAARGNNGQGVAGVTWGAKIMALKVLNDRGEGKANDVARAIDYALNNGADIINLSFVSLNYSEVLQEAIRRAHKAGVIIVAAAGNEQSGGTGYNIDKTPIYPVCYDGQLVGENLVIGVAATDALDQKAKFSSYGSRCVDISAPGISFFNATTIGGNFNYPNQAYDGYWSGTSMATPLVTATLALIEQANPELSQREVVNILFASTDNISRLNVEYSGQLGNGRLNVDRAVELAKAELYNHVDRLAIAAVNGAKELKFTSSSGDLVKKFSDPNLKTSFSFAAGDVDGDSLEELVLAGSAKSGSPLRIINQAGKLLKQFFAFDKKFRGGVNLALTDLDDNQQAEIIAVQAANGNGQVRIFDANGRLKRQFYAVGNNWRGGLSVAAGDINGDGEIEIVVGLASGGEPQIRVFSATGKPLSTFLAYEKKFRGGVKVAIANLDGRQDHNQAEIIVAPGRGRDPQIKVFNAAGQLKKQFLAFNRNWQGGINLAAGDLDNDGLAEIAVAAQPGAAPHVRTFDGAGTLLESFYSWEEGFNGGVNIGIIKMNN